MSIIIAILKDNNILFSSVILNTHHPSFECLDLQFLLIKICIQMLKKIMENWLIWFGHVHMVNKCAN